MINFEQSTRFHKYLPLCTVYLANIAIAESTIDICIAIICVVLLLFYTCSNCVDTTIA